MYKPVPARPRKTDNVRSRTGCQNCRARRTKCDEQKPTCGTCQRLQKVCHETQPQFKFLIVSNSPSSSDTDDTRTRTVECLPSNQVARGVITRLRSSFPSLGTVRSLQRTEADIFYTTCYEDRCLPALHPIFQQMLSVSEPSLMLKHATLALASCNLGRSTAEHKFSRSVECLGAFRPNPTHQTRSQSYYSEAIRCFSSLSIDDCQRNTSSVFAAIVIFAYIECSTGNLSGFETHVNGLTSLLGSLYKDSRSNFINMILVACLQPRFVNWWSRAYYSSIAVQCQLPPVPLPLMRQRGLHLPEERRLLVLSIMSESHRLNVKATLKYWETPDISEDTDFEKDRDDHDIFSLLATESKKLDEWLAQLPPSERPIHMPAPGTAGDPVPGKSMHFRSHDTTLTYAYYVVARIMQCTSFLRLLPMQDHTVHGQECSEAEPWVRLLIQVVLGSDMRTSLLRNAYTIGFSSLLLAASLRCQDHALGVLMENWLQALEYLSPTEEGSFPVFQALGVVRAINMQRMMGHDVFAVSQPVDSAGGSKSDCYCSQPISSLLMHGKTRSTGVLFTNAIAFDGQHAKVRAVSTSS